MDAPTCQCLSTLLHVLHVAFVPFQLLHTLSHFSTLTSPSLCLLFTTLVSQKLSDAWKQATAPGSNVRAVKVSIINESLEDDGLFDIQGAFEKGNFEEITFLNSFLIRHFAFLTLPGFWSVGC